MCELHVCQITTCYSVYIFIAPLVLYDGISDTSIN